MLSCEGLLDQTERGWLALFIVLFVSSVNFRRCVSFLGELMNDQLRLRLQILIGIIALFLLSNLYFFLVKLGGFILLIESVIQLTIFICVIFWVIKFIWRIMRIREWRNLANVFTVLAIPTVVILSGWESLTADENTFQSDVKVRACYEGTVNTSRLFLRENGDFEDFNIGFFGIVKYVSGRWKMDGDTIHLTFRSGRNSQLRQRMIIKDSVLFAIEADTIQPTSYYLGHCKGLN